MIDVQDFTGTCSYKVDVVRPEWDVVDVVRNGFEHESNVDRRGGHEYSEEGCERATNARKGTILNLL